MCHAPFDNYIITTLHCITFPFQSSTHTKKKNGTNQKQTIQSIVASRINTHKKNVAAKDVYEKYINPQYIDG